MFTTTITQAQCWDDENKQMKIIGDNGIDGITRRKIGQNSYNGIIQCKCYAPTTVISTDVIAQIDNNLDHWKSEKSFGLLVLLTKASLGAQAVTAIANARNPIIVVTLQEIRKGIVQQKLEEINWDDYPGKYLKRTRIEIESARDIRNVGEVQIDGKGIKRLKFEECIIR